MAYKSTEILSRDDTRCDVLLAKTNSRFLPVCFGLVPLIRDMVGVLMRFLMLKEDRHWFVLYNTKDWKTSSYETDIVQLFHKQRVSWNDVSFPFSFPVRNTTGSSS